MVGVANKPGTQYTYPSPKNVLDSLLFLLVQSVSNQKMYPGTLQCECLKDHHIAMVADKHFEGA